MIIIIGGGISGLAAAHELTRRRIPFRLLEAASRLGGLIRTEHHDGFTIELIRFSSASRPSESCAPRSVWRRAFRK
jgi:protoporphyrinogen oxidase